VGKRIFVRLGRGAVGAGSSAAKLRAAAMIAANPGKLLP
jgi:hypothetical protein